MNQKDLNLLVQFQLGLQFTPCFIICFSDSPGHEPFPICTKRCLSGQDQKWYTMSCYDSRQEKPKSSIMYQIHSSPRQTFAYDSTQDIAKIFNSAELQRIIPSTGGFLAFYFLYTTLGAETNSIVALYKAETNEIMYFLVEKDIPCAPRGIAVSPDATRVCLLVTSGGEDANDDHYDVQVYSKRPAAFEKSFQGVSFELEYEIQGLKSNRGSPMIMFDPRYVSSRLGIININSVQNIRVTHYFMVYNLKAHRAVTMPHENYIFDNDDLELLTAGYSPDGTWVHAVIGHVLPAMATKYKRFIWIINSDTLEIVKAIDIGSDSMDECFTNFLPIYSKCCRTMALRHRRSVKVYQLPVPETLRAMCRSVILQKHTDTDRLAIPENMKKYLQLKAYIV